MTWLGFGAAAWLWGLAALAVPVAIHLLSRGRQRRQQVGSVRWLAPAETLRARQLRPSRWWLLLVRCLLLASVVLALAAPRLGRPEADDARPWVLVAPEVVAERQALEPGNEVAYRALDEAAANGGALHWLAPGLAPAELAAPPAAATAGSPPDLWSLLREVDARAPRPAPLAVFGLDLEAQLVGARPTLARRVDWHPVVDRRPYRWIERATAVAGNALAVVVGVSEPDGTRFTRTVLAAAALPAADSPLEVTPAADGWRLKLHAEPGVSAEDELAVPAASPVLTATLLASAEREEDARYVAAALAAAAEVADRVLELERLPVEATGELRTAELVFWLSEAPVPQSLLERLAGGGLLVSDAVGRFERCELLWWLDGGAPLRADRCAEIEPGRGGAVTLWSAPDGRALLVAERIGDGRWLRFASRWNPAWTDLVLSPSFPAWILARVEEEAALHPTAQRPGLQRRAAGAQAVPGERAPAPGRDGGRELPLAAWLWLPALFLAAGERWLAARSAR